MKNHELIHLLRGGLHFLFPLCEDPTLKIETKEGIRRATAEILNILIAIDEQADANMKTLPEHWKFWLPREERQWAPKPGSSPASIKHQARVSLAKDLLRDGYLPRYVAQQTLLPLEEVQELALTYRPNGRPYPIRRWLELIALTEDEYRKSREEE